VEFFDTHDETIFYKDNIEPFACKNESIRCYKYENRYQLYHNMYTLKFIGKQSQGNCHAKVILVTLTISKLILSLPISKSNINDNIPIKNVLIFKDPKHAT
jgi:hypothetical protein